MVGGDQRRSQVTSHWSRNLGRAALTFALLLPWQGEAQNPIGVVLDFSEAERRMILQHGPWPPRASRDPSNRVSGKREAIELGEKLFFEPRLSTNGALSCASCHVPEKSFTDGRKLAMGLVEVDRNTPTLFNLRTHRWFGWDGASDNLWAQSIRPMLDPREMGVSERHIAVANVIDDDAQRKSVVAFLDREFDELERRFLIGLADAAADSWEQPDHGIWEMRGEPRHFLYSKLMCWVALDRALDLAGDLEADDRVEAWARERQRIREAILDRGWSDEAGVFTQSFESVDLDASNLLMSRVGFLPPDDERVLATIEATEERLTDHRGLVYRYRAKDGLAGEEGAFLLCTFWLAGALAQAGQVDRARDVFARACTYTNDVGLLAEEVDADSGELLGNFPQAFSHIGLINAAWAISRGTSPGRRLGPGS